MAKKYKNMINSLKLLETVFVKLIACILEALFFTSILKFSHF